MFNPTLNVTDLNISHLWIYNHALKNTDNIVLKWSRQNVTVLFKTRLTFVWELQRFDVKWSQLIWTSEIWQAVRGTRIHYRTEACCINC